MQSFLNNEIFEAGITQISYNNSDIRIYDLERMLIELMRFRAKMPKDYYKVIIQNYRRIANDMDFCLVEEYADLFRNGGKLMDMIQMEVL